MGVAEGCALRATWPRTRSSRYADVVPAGGSAGRPAAGGAGRRAAARTGGGLIAWCGPPCVRCSGRTSTRWPRARPSPPVGCRHASLVHARWRAVLVWRVAQHLFGARSGKPLSVAGRSRAVLQGAELQPKSAVGPGLVLKHTTGLVVGGDVVAGEHLTLHQNVTLGDRRPFGGQPVLGDDVTVGAGACVLGPITIGDRVVVAANAAG